MHVQLLLPFRPLIELRLWLPNILHICIVHGLMCKVDNPTLISLNRANIMFHCIGMHENNGT